jgi:WD40 repeat protein
MDEKLAELGLLRSAAETLLEQHLVDVQGNRKILTEAEARAALPDYAATAVLQQLENAAILRSEEHHGGRYFELGHDWLAKKVFEVRTARLEKRRQEEERAAARLARIRLARFGATSLLVAVVLAVGLWWSWRQHEAAHDALAIEGARELLARNEWEQAASLLLQADRPEERSQWLSVAVSVANMSPLSRVLRGHEDKLTMAVWSPDGNRAVTTSLDGTARVWDLAGTLPPVVLRGHGGPVHGAAWSLDSKRIVTASADGTARVWELSNLGNSFALPCGGEVFSAVFTPDGRRVVTASAAGARVWDVEGSHDSVALGATPPVHAVAVSPDGKSVAAADDSYVRVWSLPGAFESEHFTRSRPYADAVGSLAFSPDGGRLLALYSVDHTAQIWELGSSGRSVALETPEGPLVSAAWSRDGQKVVTAASTVQVWTLGPQKGRLDLPTEGRKASFAAMSADGTKVVAACDGGTAWVWDLAAPDKPHRLQGHVQGFHDRLSFAAFSPDSSRVLTASDNGNAHVWTLAGRLALGDLIGHTEAVRSAAISPDGRRVLTGSDDGTARLWDLDGSGRFVELRGSPKIVAAAISPDGARAYTASPGGSSVWDLTGPSGPARTGRFEGLESYEPAPVWSPDSESLLVVSRGFAHVQDVAANRNVLWAGPADAAAVDGRGDFVVAGSDGVWRINHEGWERARLLDSPGSRVEVVSVSRDGKRALLVTSAGGARVWELDGSRKSQPLSGQNGTLHLAWLEPDGRRAVTVALDEIRVWDLSGSNRSFALQRKDHYITSAARSPDGQRIAAGYEDGAVYVWRAAPEGADSPSVILAHKQPVESIAWSLDGARIVTASRDHTARVLTDVPALLSLFRAVSVRCLSRDVRKTYLAETGPEAWVRYQLCERWP